MSQSTLYYDGKCPLCRREIRLLARMASGLALVDIHAADGLDAQQKERFLQVLHLRRADGSWATGVEATVAAWRCTPIGWLWEPLRWPGLRRITEPLYQAWAQRRYDRLYACRAASR